MNALSSQRNVFNRTISFENSAIVINDNSANYCSVSAMHLGDGAHYRSSGALGGAFGVYFGASLHSTSSETLSSLVSGHILSRNLAFSFQNNNISSCSAFLNVTGEAQVAAVDGGALAFQIGFFSFAQVKFSITSRCRL